MSIRLIWQMSLTRLLLSEVDMAALPILGDLDDRTVCALTGETAIHATADGANLWSVSLPVKWFPALSCQCEGDVHRLRRLQS